MALPKTVQVKESLKELKSLQKKSKRLFVPRLQMLLVIKQSNIALSKHELAKLVSVNHNSIQKWRTLYIKGGITNLLSHKTNASRPSVFTAQEKLQIESKLKDPKNGFQGYKELHIWVTEYLNKDVKCNTLMVFCKNNFGTKIKVARKSHVKKDEKAVATFKKTLVIS